MSKQTHYLQMVVTSKDLHRLTVQYLFPDAMKKYKTFLEYSKNII